MGHLLDSYGDLGAVVRGALSPSNYATLASCPNTLSSPSASPYPPPPVCDADSNVSSCFLGLYNPPCTLTELPNISSLNTELVNLSSFSFSPHHYNQLLPSQPAPDPSLHSSFSSSMSSSEPFDCRGGAMSCSIMAMEGLQHQLQPSLPIRGFPLKVKEEMETILHPCTSLLSDVSAMSGSHPHAPQAFAETTKTTAKTELMSPSAMAMDHLNKGRAPRRRKLIQKRVVHIPAVGEISSKSNAGETVPTDMWAWRKYGQKPIKGSPYPRGYYRCSSSKGCPARKQVERNPNDPAMLVVTYTSEHNHAWQTHRINSLAGSTRPAQAESPPPMAVSMSNTKLSPNAFNMSPVRFDNMDDDDDDASLLSHDDGVDNDLVQGLSHVLQGLERDHGEEASFLAVNSAFTPASAPYPAGDNAAKSDAMTWSGLAARSSFMDIMAENNAGASKTTRAQCAHDVGHGTVMAAETTAREVSWVEDDSSHMFDVLLSEMLEEVQKQNRAKMEVMMMMEEGEEKGLAPFITWSNNINFVS